MVVPSHSYNCLFILLHSGSTVASELSSNLSSNAASHVIHYNICLQSDYGVNDSDQTHISEMMHQVDLCNAFLSTTAICSLGRCCNPGRPKLCTPNVYLFVKFIWPLMTYSGWHTIKRTIKTLYKNY